MDEIMELIRGSGGTEVWDIWPDYPCRRCKKFIDGNGDVCKCIKRRSWFARIWRTFYRGGGEK